jgi:prepilin-type N-terminal cleavage/methylation domain-containing protein
MVVQKSKQCGFTLIEALIAMLLLGFAITGLIVANQTFTQANGAGLQLSTAEFLIEQIREQTVEEKIFANLATFNTSGFDPTSYPGYSRKTTVEYVNASDLRTVSTSGPTPFYRITVEIRLNNETLSSASWLRANY